MELVGQYIDWGLGGKRVDLVIVVFRILLFLFVYTVD